MNTALLLSGGIDSVALAFWLRPSTALTVDYGQLAAHAEIQAAATVCHQLSIKHEIIRVNCLEVGSGALAARSSAVVAPAEEWWPFRNQLLVTLAGSRMIAIGMHHCELVVGSVADDSSYADSTAHFYTSVDALMAVQEGGIRVRAPAIEMTALELIYASGVPSSVLAWSHSCHRGNMACSKCQGCRRKLQIFRSLGLSV